MSNAGRDSAACLSVVMPVFNEEATVRDCVAAVLARPEVAEVVIVDDASTDGTRDILATVNDPRVRVFHQGHNQGKGAALRRGFAEATADFVIVQDADLEYDPAEYPRVLGPLLAGRADVVYGSRFAGGEAHRVLFFWHSLGNRVLTLASNAFTDLNLTDMETCYKHSLRSFTRDHRFRTREGTRWEFSGRIDDQEDGVRGIRYFGVEPERGDGEDVRLIITTAGCNSFTRVRIREWDYRATCRVSRP
jgi:glycosyltransferase involved in cell wall biosynthesis